MAKGWRISIVLLVVLVGLVGCDGASTDGGGEGATPTLVPTPIVPTQPTYEVKRGEVVKTVQFTGRVAPVVEQELFFRTAGYVGNVFVERNEWVNEGDILAELEVTDLKNQLAQAEAALESARANQAQRVAEAEAALQTAELELARLQAQDPNAQVTIADVALERAQMHLADAEEELQKAKDRPWEWKYDEVKESYTRQVTEAELSLKQAQAQYNQAVQARQAHQYSVQIQEQNVELARMRLEQLEEGLDIEELRLTVERLQAQLADARLVAPFDGQVLSVSISEGRAVEGYRTVMVVADPNELEVSADLTDRILQDLAEDMPVTAALVSRPDQKVSGHIRRLPYPYGGGGRVVSGGAEEEDKSTRIALEGDINYEQGDLVRVTVVLERREDVLWLPPQAIRTFEGRDFVVVEEGDGRRRVDIQTGIESDDRVEIEEGLEEGQIVIGQ
jgi:multidrug efflux pump subunit AcrA (membrane-fusion protein)